MKALLISYSRKDVAQVMKFFDDKNVLMMGADASEVSASKKGIEKLLRDDFMLWESSEFGDFKNFHFLVSDNMASVFFDVPWRAKSGGQSREFLIRFATTWRKAGGRRWKLTQILNAVPTVAQSAREIIQQTQKKSGETKTNP